MKDEEIEALLGRYRPVARVPALRQPRAWPWAVAAAALLGITIGLHAGVTPPPESPSDQARVQAIADQLGGGPVARAVAESMIDAEAARDGARVAGPMSGLAQ